MTRWEYFYLVRLDINGENRVCGYATDGTETLHEPWTTHNDAWGKSLTHLGNQGWELVGMTGEDSCIFKRPKEDDDQD